LVGSSHADGMCNMVTKLNNNKWPKGPTYWIDDRVMHVSIPFTWNLTKVLNNLLQREFYWDTALVGGPAVELMPTFFEAYSDFITVAHEMPYVLQRVNKYATRTTIGCPNRCKFCAVPTIEGVFQELHEWPDLPILCDNNLLNASQPHLDKVFDRLEKHEDVDFNQGLDARLLNEYHIERLSRLKHPKIRLACDSEAMLNPWLKAYEMLVSRNIPKSWIHTYVLIGFDSDPIECWKRCDFIEKRCKAYPQWFHSLKCTEYNEVTDGQRALGWTNKDRLHIMGFYYMHRGVMPQF